MQQLRSAEGNKSLGPDPSPQFVCFGFFKTEFCCVIALAVPELGL